MVINGKKYKLIRNNRDGYDETIIEKITDYYEPYDYIFGDWAYGKVRLKGFYKSDNENASNINDIKYLDDYIKENCAFGCRYFLLEKV